MNLIIKGAVFVVAVYLTNWLLPGIIFRDIGTGLTVAIILAAVNIFVKPILKIFTFPAIILTLGLFQLFVNTVIILLIDVFVEGFQIVAQTYIFTFFWAFLFGIILSVVSVVLEKVVKA